jgi:hypothetical protein
MRDVKDLGTDGDLGAGSEVLAEALISQRALCSWAHDSSIAVGGGFNLKEGDGSSSANTGSYLIDLDLESQRVAGGEGSLGLVAGVIEYTAAPDNAHVLNIFGEHTIMASLDLNTLTWSIAV